LSAIASGSRKGHYVSTGIIVLEKAVGSTHMAQALNLLGYMKKVLIAIKMTTYFFITPFKSYILHSIGTPNFSFKDYSNPLKLQEK
jgi:hypothetical protein